MQNNSNIFFQTAKNPIIPAIGPPIFPNLLNNEVNDKVTLNLNVEETDYKPSEQVRFKTFSSNIIV